MTNMPNYVLSSSQTSHSLSVINEKSDKLPELFLGFCTDSGSAVSTVVIRPLEHTAESFPLSTNLKNGEISIIRRYVALDSEYFYSSASFFCKLFS